MQLLPASITHRRILGVALVAAHLNLPSQALDTTLFPGLTAVEGTTGFTHVAGNCTEQVSIPLPTAAPASVATFSRLPLSFVRNDGQADPATRFELRGRGYLMSFESTEAVMVLDRRPSECAESRDFARVRQPSAAVGLPAAPGQIEAAAQFHTLRMKLVGAHSNAVITGGDELPGKFNYLIGNDPALWRTNVPTFAKVRYREVYPGIDLVYYGNDGQLEYDFVVKPGADPDQIALAIEGADAVEVDDNGDLRLALADQELHWRKPKIYQEIDGLRVPVAGEYVLRPGVTDQDGARRYQVAFHVEPYDRMLALVIDPVLAYSTYLGGSALEEVSGIAVDSEGYAYLTGRTASHTFYTSRFPTTEGALQRDFPGPDTAAFVTKLSPSGDRMIYSTVFSGTTAAGDNTGTEASAIAVDSAGRVVIAGTTADADLPTLNAFQPQHAGGNWDMFVSKLNHDGSGLVFSSYLGGSLGDGGELSAIDGKGNILLVCRTRSPDFPIVNALQSTLESEFSSIIAKVAADGSHLVYSTFLPQELVTGNPFICAATDTEGRAYVAGYNLESVDGNTVASDPFLFRLNPAGSALEYTRRGVIGVPVYVSAIAVDSAGTVFLAGSTRAPNLPTTPGAFQSAYGGGYSDGFIARINSNTSNLGYLTYVGGNNTDGVTSMAVDSTGNVYAGGGTGSPDFPVQDAIQSRFNQGLPPDVSYEYDAFALKLSPDGQRLHWSTFLGGGKGPNAGDPGRDQAFALALGPEGSVYLGGSTDARDFPVMNPIQRSLSIQVPFGGLDGFVAKIVEPPPPPTVIQVTRSGGSVSISWPTSAIGYTLEYTGVLAPAANWQPEPTAPEVVGDQNVVRIEIAAGPRYFRLNKP